MEPQRPSVGRVAYVFFAICVSTVVSGFVSAILTSCGTFPGNECTGLPSSVPMLAIFALFLVSFPALIIAAILGVIAAVKQDHRRNSPQAVARTIPETATEVPATKQRKYSLLKKGGIFSGVGAFIFGSSLLTALVTHDGGFIGNYHESSVGESYSGLLMFYHAAGYAAFTVAGVLLLIHLLNLKKSYPHLFWGVMTLLVGIPVVVMIPR